MAASRFTSNNGPCKIKMAAELPLLHQDDNKAKADCDPESLQQCPYDKNHQIRACRFPYHIIKCRKNHPKLATELSACPFNARHLIHKTQIAKHIETCVNRISVENDDARNSGDDFSRGLPVSEWVNPNMTEDWDSESDDTAAPFIWGVSTNIYQSLDMQPTNKLGPHCRAPSVLPWSMEDF